MNNKDSKSFELEFLNLINSYLKRQGGKGPRQTDIRFMGDTIVYYIYGVLNERERKLIQTEEGKRIVIEARRLFLELDKEVRIPTFEKLLGCDIIENYESWNLQNDSAVGVFRLKEKIF